MMCVGHEDSESVMWQDDETFARRLYKWICIWSYSVWLQLYSVWERGAHHSDCMCKLCGGQQERGAAGSDNTEGEAHNVTTRDKKPCSCTCLLSSSMMAQRCVEGTAAAEALL